MSRKKGKIINYKGVQYLRERATNLGGCSGCELNLEFNEFCKYSKECELTGTVLKKKNRKE